MRTAVVSTLNALRGARAQALRNLQRYTRDAEPARGAAGHSKGTERLGDEPAAHGAEAKHRGHAADERCMPPERFTHPARHFKSMQRTAKRLQLGAELVAL